MITTICMSFLHECMIEIFIAIKYNLRDLERRLHMLSIRNLTKTYGNKTAVSGLSLEVEAGDICAFIGHNGAGKTTTIKAAVGIIDFEGDIFIDGVSIKENPILCKRKFAYIPDNPDLYEYLTGIQYLNFIADIFKLSTAERKQRIEKLGTELGLSDELANLISSYSHGMKQKLAVIGALLHEPKLLILDEPFVGLDPEAVVTLKAIMRRICSEGGAVFFSTHVLDVAEKLCNKAAIIRDGRLVAYGSMNDLTDGKSLEDVFLEVVRHA